MEDILHEYTYWLSKIKHLMTAWTEIPTFAGKRHKKIFPAIITVYTTEPVFQKSAVQVLINGFLNNRTQCAIAIFISLFIFPTEFSKVVFDNLVKRSISRIALSINSGLHAFL